MWNMNESSTDRCLPCPRALLPALHAETRTHAHTHTQRGSYFRGAVPVEETVSVGGDEEGMPKPGEPLFVLKSQAMAVPPTKYKKPDDADDAPLGGLQMEFIYGARMIDSRACAQYTGHGHVVFIAGATAVVYSPIQHTQKFFNGHTEDVIALALHPDCVTAATGQVGRKALLCVWDTYTMQTYSVIRGFHDHGICSLSFSGDGSKLVSVGMDIDHSIAVWTWESGHKVASATCSIERVFACAFNPSDDTIVTIGVGHVKFWQVHGRLLRGRSGNFTQGNKQQAFVSLAVSKKGRIFVGSEQGEIYRWKNGEVDSLVVAHDGPVFALWVCRDGLASGGKDGLVKVFSLALKPLVEFDMRTQSTGLDRTRIRSVCWLVRTILVGTHDSELFEIDIEAGAPNLLLQGHRAGKVSGLHTHPSKRVFVTGGADQTVRVWDMDARKQTSLRTLDGPVRTVCISLDGAHIACGLEDGRLVVLKLKTMRIHLERKDRQKAINEVRYSANGKMLAVAGDDAQILIYDVLSEYEWIGTCVGHKGAVMNLDWSSDSKLLQSDDSLGYHMYWDVESCKEMLVAAEIRDVEWATWTCIMGWPVQGIAPKFQGPLGINSTCRSSFGDTLATCDDWGMLKLFRFPCITAGARCKRYGGHSARVGKVRFSFEEKTLVTSGLVDGAIIQWRYLSSGKLMELDEVLSDDDDEMEQEAQAGLNHDDKQDSDVENELVTRFGRGESQVTVDKTGIMQVKSERMITGKETVSFESRGFEHKAGDTQINLTTLNGDEDGGGKAKGSDWRKPMDADEAPYNSLQLEHAYGYRGHDCRNNLLYTAEGHIVYMVAAIGVVYHKDGHAQQFYSMHTDDIISIAMHPDKRIVATGQVGKVPLIQVWQSNNMQTLASLRGFHEMGVAAMGFNKDGTKLASVGLDQDHSIAIWDWRKAVRLATCPGHTDKIFEARFNPVDDVLVTCGVSHVKFWSMQGDNQLKGKKAVYGQDGLSHTMLCCAFTDAGLALTGGLNGHVFLWKGSHLEWQFEEAHAGPVFALSTYPDGFVSGGKDGRVRLWSGLDPVKIFDFSGTCVASSIATRIRSAAWRDGQVLVGTMSNEIFEVDERSMTQRLIVQSHAGAEVWGLDTHPTQAAFATGGEDATVRIYKMSSRKASMVREVKSGCKTVAYNKDGSALAAGLVDGTVVVLETKKLNVICERRTHEAAISDVKFSPDGRFLATTCVDGSLDVYDSQNDYELTGTARTREGAALTHLDWSSDGLFLQTDNSFKVHQYWDAGSLVEQVGAEDTLSRASWHTWTCTYGWSVQGLAPKMAEVSGVNAVARNNGGNVLAVALDFGVIALYRFPCPYVGTKHKRYAGHSAGVSKVCFSKDDKYMISVGALDRCIMQWEHISD